MQILLINAPIRLDAVPSCIPYGLATVATALRRDGFGVEIYDINALRPTESEILATLQSKQWDVVGVSGLVTTYGFQKWLIPHLKRLQPQATMVSGGGLATSNGSLLMAKTAVDVTVQGEGEKTMPELCRALAVGGTPEEIPGIQWRQNGRIIKNRIRANIADPDTIGFPAWDLLPMEIYLANPIWGDVAGNSSGFKKDVTVNRSMNVIASRGCPFACNYCYHLFGRGDYRFRSVAHVITEAKTLVERYQVDFIGFVDDNMMASQQWLLNFCDALIELQLPLTWGCHGRVTSARPDVLERMAAAGCIWIGYGIESGSQKILDAMNKKASVARAKQAIIDTRRAGIFPNTTFIFGYPGETVATIQETVDFKRELEIRCGSFFATPYPGTPLYRQIRIRIGDEEAFIASLRNATDFRINLTEFDDPTLLRLKAAMDQNRDVTGGDGFPGP